MKLVENAVTLSRPTVEDNLSKSLAATAESEEETSEDDVLEEKVATQIKLSGKVSRARHCFQSFAQEIRKVHRTRPFATTRPQENMCDM